MGQIQFMGAILLVVLFSIAVVGYATNFANDNDVYVTLNNDSFVTGQQSDLESGISTFKTQANSSVLSLTKGTIASGDETTETGSQFKGSVSGIFDSMKAALNTAYARIFGQEQGNSGLGIFLVALISFLTVLMGLYIWKTWAGKTPD